MPYDENSPFYRLLSTKYKHEEETLGIALKSGNKGAIGYLQGIGAVEA